MTGRNDSGPALLLQLAATLPLVLQLELLEGLIQDVGIISWLGRVLCLRPQSLPLAGYLQGSGALYVYFPHGLQFSVYTGKEGRIYPYLQVNELRQVK